jgi:hypothetical protein
VQQVEVVLADAQRQVTGEDDLPLVRVLVALVAVGNSAMPSGSSVAMASRAYSKGSSSGYTVMRLS